MRKPVSSHVRENTIIVCDDGSTWRWNPKAEEWKETPAIPGTVRATELLRRPVSSHVAADGKEMVLCDDGSAWKRNTNESDWYEFEPIPGSRQVLRRNRIGHT